MHVPLTPAACTLCHTDLALQLREAVLGPSFWPQLLEVGVAIVALLAVLLWITRPRQGR